ncbi:phosphinothricin acetyltransferase [Tamaricihabitans halophyticus]|uniref:Phosphinothricin acetyltransferase n=1 Tax=Tamaricihabitans halophyticus TaxID=1262583 RepID=A0A4R2R2C9_9PSEU|nr:GNAT family N-acetyltransferase [Tamaricihabitans halophyticus]TCP53641.1 phosphinothricin acetyltransferase [Tamaricihabitans halophyticus]
MDIRAARADDLGDISRIYRRYVLDSVVTFAEIPPDAASWRARLDDAASSGLPFLVAHNDAALAGYAYAKPWRAQQAYRYTVEESIYLAPWAVGRGVGRLLLDGLLARCREVGVREVIAVIVDGDDPASFALHHRCGFTEAGRLRGVGRKHGRDLDTVLLQCRLADSTVLG